VDEDYLLVLHYLFFLKMDKVVTEYSVDSILYL